MERSTPFEETVDEDGYPCENLELLTQWVEATLIEVLAMDDIQLKAVNFSTYGASLVHLDNEGKPVAPLYNYLKPFPAKLKERFYGRYRGEETFALETASPVLGNLNSGLQLYMIKEDKPGLFQHIRYSLHLPQYMSYLVTGRTYADITSLGCHTALWNFSKNYYHEWLYREGIAEKMAPVFPSDQALPSAFKGHALLCGVGLHDSSAALIPYLSSFKDPFVLLSTGTWCISLNPFNQNRLTAEELQQDCLCYMEYRGKPIKASRFFAGYEHEQEIKLLAAHFNVSEDYYKTVKVDQSHLSKYNKVDGISSIMNFSGESISGKRNLSDFATYEEAYHQFMIDLVEAQVYSTNLILKDSPVERMYVDGGFGKNKLFMQLLATAFPHLEIHAASLAQASAVGAALAIHPSWNKNKVPENLIKLQQYAAAAL